MDGVEALEAEKLYAFSRSFFQDTFGITVFKQLHGEGSHQGRVPNRNE